MAMIDSIPKNFDPHSAAERYYGAWEAAGLFSPDPSAPGEPYCIVIPPPNVTGSLHMGHALNNTLQDVLIRYKRMDGYNVLWVPGTDHAGIATQWMVESQLRRQGIDRRDLGREEFLRQVWLWKEESGGTITYQLRKLGVSCDWRRERFTMDPGLSAAVKKVFLDYYKQGLIYRAERLINWDPVGQTALSDLEVEAEEDYQTELWSFAYPLADQDGLDEWAPREIVVATTRPETMLGDTAIAVHPDDPRYSKLVGRLVRHPILDRLIPIVGDKILVDPAFGTGAVKVTPAHDFNDFAVGKRHDLPFINLLNPDGTLNDNCGPFEGLHVDQARDAVKTRIRELGLERGSQPHTMALPRSQRSGAVVQPLLSTQWFVKMGPLAGPALAAVERGFTRFVPTQWENTYYAWMRNIQDWCISRQLWWGHRIPAWYCQDCDHITVTADEVLASCEGCGGTRIRQDEDVLDTWFSSALWPFSTLGWPEDTNELRRWYPTSVLITGFDIIFFWVARMIFSGQHLMGAVPFKDVYIHALVRDEHGQKMSKTKGNVVDPLDVINKVGTDAFRFTMVALAAQGRDVLWSDNRAQGAVKFQNKIWQAFRFTAMHLDGYDPSAPRTESAYDHWILARLGAAVARVRDALDGYRFNEAAQEIYAFTWDELCDWYLELSKATLYGDSDTPEAQAASQGARHTLFTVFHALLRLMHPIMPFLSEELWGHLPGVQGSVMVAPYPRATDFPQDDGTLDEVALLQETIVAVRRVRADMELALKVRLKGRMAEPGPLMRHQGALRDLAGIEPLEQGGREGLCATAVVRGQELILPLDGVIDVAAERERLGRDIDKTSKDLAQLEAKLANNDFVARAPADVVAGFQTKLAAARERLAALGAARALLGDQ
jgi:valyl-tRNA synthetase